jgi:alpha-ketoglutarate-dependent taurine dioxygenase
MQFEINQDPDCIKGILEDNHEKNNMLRVSRLGDNQNEGLFADALAAYDQLNKRTEKIIVKLAIKEWTTEARKYSKK